MPRGATLPAAFAKAEKRRRSCNPFWGSATSPHPPSPARRSNAAVMRCGIALCRCDGAGLSCAVRDSNPRALPSRHHRAGFPACNFPGSCRPGVRYLLRDYRLARLILLRVHRPVRGLDLDIELSAVAGKLICSSANGTDVKRPHEPDLRAAVARLLLRRCVRDRLQRSMQEAKHIAPSGRLCRLASATTQRRSKSTLRWCIWTWHTVVGDSARPGALL